MSAASKISEASAVSDIPTRSPLVYPKAKIERASFPLKAGIAVVEMPAELSEEDYDDFEAWIQLIMRKARRSISSDARLLTPSERASMERATDEAHAKFDRLLKRAE